MKKYHFYLIMNKTRSLKHISKNTLDASKNNLNISKEEFIFSICEIKSYVPYEKEEKSKKDVSINDLGYILENIKISQENYEYSLFKKGYEIDYTNKNKGGRISYKININDNNKNNQMFKFLINKFNWNDNSIQPYQYLFINICNFMFHEKKQFEFLKNIEGVIFTQTKNNLKIIISLEDTPSKLELDNFEEFFNSLIIKQNKMIFNFKLNIDN